MNDMKALEQQVQDLRAQIQKSEKLSSLGILSAGIAHEIQNPLNFVINFSQMSNDMVDDLTDILDEKGIDLEDEANDELKETIATLRSYLAKIAEHGHRATDIIQGILLYSRGRSDEFMPTSIPKLLKEYVWLSFHAMRANLADFNVSIQEDYDPTLPEVKVIPQDISRAIINLMNNACYAVWKKQHDTATESAYIPTVCVKAYQQEQTLYICIEDNGIGMSDQVKRKLFDAFFTTKPVGEGTGLGLSITRDIIEVKHHGQIKFESEENKYTRFTISIPMNL